jgi:hypothetical protein
MLRVIQYMHVDAKYFTYILYLILSEQFQYT